MTPEQRDLYDRLGKLAHFVRRRARYQSSSMHTLDVQHAAWLKLMAGRHSSTLEQSPMELWAYAESVVGSILEDWRRAKAALKRGQGQIPLSIDGDADDSTRPQVQIVDKRAEAQVAESWAGAWLSQQLGAFVEGVTTATVKDATRRTQMARAYWLHFIAGCTHEEIASILELPNKQVAWRFVDFVDRHLRRCAASESSP